MKKIVMAGMVAVALLGGAAYAEDKPVNPQHQRMKDCNAEAKSQALKGQARKDFMKACLSGKHDDTAASAAPSAASKADKTAEQAAKQDKRAAQKEKMKACNSEAKEKALKGQERKDFMKTCLSG